VLHEKPWEYDSKVVPLPWRESEEDAVKTKLGSSGLTVGFYNFDGNVCFQIPDLLAFTDFHRCFHTLPFSVVSIW
jgi:hypothetical protein